MAISDYRTCDVCEENPYGNKLWRLGDWAVICIECSKNIKLK